MKLSNVVPRMSVAPLVSLSKNLAVGWKQFSTFLPESRSQRTVKPQNSMRPVN